MSIDNVGEKKLKENIVKFLLVASIGSVEKKDWIQNSIKRAYLDFCRTMDYKKKYKKNKNIAEKTALTKEQEKDMEAEIQRYYKTCSDLLSIFLRKMENGLITNNDFNKQHEEVCKELIEVSFFTMNYGQAQKWVNMSIKYLFIYEEILPSNHRIIKLLDNLHVPVDNVVLELLSGKVKPMSEHISKPVDKIKKAWSKWNEAEYLAYKKNMDDSLTITPFLWELENWITLEEIEKRKKSLKNE